MKSRADILNDIVHLSAPLLDSIGLLRQFDWDSENALVTVTPNDIVKILQQFIDSQLSQQDVEAWANAIEGRDDIAYEGNHKDAINDVIFSMANPELTESMSIKFANELIDKLT